MKKFTKEKGITLIALVITIIVMLILVAVTISVAINGGLFSKANDAAKKTQMEIDREELQAAILDTIDNNGDIHLDQIRLDNNKWSKSGNTFKATHSNGDENAFTVTIANGGFTVTYVEPTTGGEKVYYLNDANLGEVYIVGYTFYSHEGSGWYTGTFVEGDIDPDELEGYITLINNALGTNYNSSEIGIYGSGTVGFIKANNDWYYPASINPVELVKFEEIDLDVSVLENAVNESTQSNSGS